MADFTPTRDENVIVFGDTETIRLPNGDKVVWDAAIIRRTYTDDWTRVTGETVHCWQLPVDLGEADPISLDIGGYYQRRWTSLEAGPGTLLADDDEHDTLVARAVDGYPNAAPPDGDTYHIVPTFNLDDWAQAFARLTHGAHWIGACGMFDTNRLEPFLRRWRACPGWHYQVHDIEDIAAGYLLGRQSYAVETRSEVTVTQPLAPVLPWSSDALAIALGINVDETLRHTALGDARMVANIWDTVTGHQLRPPAR